MEELTRDRFRAASNIMADAFLDDPGWRAVGPDGQRRLHPYIRRICHGVLRVVARHGGFTWQVERDGAVAGVLAGLDSGQWPPPQITATAMQALGPLLAGPRTLLRSFGGDAAMHRGHPDEPHTFVWMLAVAPSHQRRGVGRALLLEALERAAAAGTPTYLDTANPANLPYYGSFGFEPIGQTTLPRGAPLWFMYRA